MKKEIRISCSDNNISLRSITGADNENLREWKNRNRKSFFYQQIITCEQQQEWFENYMNRSDDFIFMIFIEENPIGCVGFRKSENVIDLYNIIRGTEENGKGRMHTAFYMMLNYIKAHYEEKIQCDVLKDNEAVNWYKKTGFAICAEKEYYVMSIEKDRIPDMELVVEEVSYD